MCLYCDLWGEGMVWYLNPKNYSRHMYTIPEPKKVPKEAFASGVESELGSYLKMQMEMIDAMEKGSAEYEASVKRHKEMEDFGQGSVGGWAGQVTPLREAEKIVEIANPMGLMACLCRNIVLAREERTTPEKTCMGVGVGMLKWERWPERYKGGVYWMNTEEAKEWLRDMDKKGFVHAVMLFGHRFIGGICNCDYPVCNMMLAPRLDFGLNLLKGHHVAMCDFDVCNGCGICAQRCQFGALKMNVTANKANIDQMRCFGCGLCETGCPRGAISLVERGKIPRLQEVW